jgi:hypothetical protein
MTPIKEMADDICFEIHEGRCNAPKCFLYEKVIEALRKQRDEILGEQRQCRFGLSEECGNLCWQMPYHYLKIREGVLKEKLLQQDKDDDIEAEA